MHDIPDRSLNDKSEVVGNVVILAEWFHDKRPQGKPFAVLEDSDAKFWLIREIFLAFQDNGFRKIPRVHGQVTELAKKIRDGSNMVVVAVRNKQSQNVFFLSLEVGDIGDDIVHSRHIFFGHAEAHINQQNFAVVFQYHHVSTNLAQSAQRDNAEIACLP